MITPSRDLLLWVARLYPRAWRGRYGEEFAAMIEDLPEGRARWATAGDILRGALFMRVRKGVAGVAAVGALAGFVIAAGVSLAMPDRYITGAVVQVGGEVGDKELTAVVTRTLDAEVLEQLIAKHSLYGSSGNATERMQQDVQVSFTHRRADGSRALRISFVHTAPEMARRVARELTTVMMQGQSGLKLLDEPALPRTPMSPNRLSILMFGLNMGMVAGFGVGCVRSLVERVRTRA